MSREINLLDRYPKSTRPIDERALLVTDTHRGTARELGWRPGIGFEDGIAEVVDWVEASWDQVKEQPLEYMHKP